MVPIHLTSVHYLFALHYTSIGNITKNDLVFSFGINVKKSSRTRDYMGNFLNTPHRAGINRRSEALSACPDKSFEGNQSFPRISKRQLKRYEIDLATPMRKKFDNMDKIRGKLSQFLLI